MSLPLEHYLIFSLLLLSLGIFGVLARRNAIGVLIAIELILNAVNLNLVVFSRTVSSTPETGQIFAFFVIALAAAGAAVGLAIVMAIYRSRKSVQMQEFNLMKW